MFHVIETEPKFVGLIGSRLSRDEMWWVAIPIVESSSRGEVGKKERTDDAMRKRRCVNQSYSLVGRAHNLLRHGYDGEARANLMDRDKHKGVTLTGDKDNNGQKIVV